MRVALSLAPDAPPWRQRGLGELLRRTFLARTLFAPALSDPLITLDVGGGNAAPPAGRLLTLAQWPGMPRPDGWREALRPLLRLVREAPSVEDLRRALFRHEAGGVHCDFDLVAVAVALLDRWEESETPDRDDLGRFPPTRSILFEERTLGRPVVDWLGRALGEELARMGGYRDRPEPASVLRGHAWCFAATLDIDSDSMWWPPRRALHHLKATRPLGARALARGVAQAAHCLVQPAADPHRNLESIGVQLEALGARASFFVQTHAAHRLDNYNLDAKSPLLAGLGAVLDAGHEVGLHSSCATLEGRLPFEPQWDRLKARLPGRVAPIHRAHWLRAAGKSDPARCEAAVDSSLAYGGVCGFRTGTAIPYRLEDSTVWEAPPVAMDTTMRLREGLSPDQAFARLRALMNDVAATGGTLVLIAHPQYLEPLLWPGWRELLLDVVAEARRQGALLGTLSELAALYRGAWAETLPFSRDPASRA